LIFIYIWAGPHHLLYSALPDWTQSLGTVFSVMLIAPSWGGMLNGLLTLRGAWDRVREDPILKFMVVAVTAYGMSTFEGPMLSIKSVNAIAHFTDWIPAHVHIGTLGWNGFLTFGMFYWMFPRLFGTTLYSKKLANIHFWIGTLGILFWVVPMYFAGWTQSLMWKDFTPEGLLKYGNFVTTLQSIKPMLALRAFGGSLYLTGALIGFFNLMKTAQQGKLIRNEAAEAPALHIVPEPNESVHRKLERKPVPLLIWALIAILVGGAVEFFPMTFMKSSVPKIESVKPYTALELQGRDIYIREGCVSCHSQEVRPFRSETVRYGEYSKAGEYIYDRPFLWGSKRTGPDLHRVGGKYRDSWHYNHMLNPQNTEKESIMPPYPWLFKNNLDNSSIAAKIRVLRKLGTPYPAGYEEKAPAEMAAQADKIVKSLASDIKDLNPDELKKKEIVALIAYLQRLGTDIKAK
ncbi:MAG TPA: cytochrome-c oxidase, cbb3-type subunit II, partial [Saprospiraceae bacterium]|nr:cytochrome-c oxidase, cbb3-type subunit II [Saprospiraceae bacterium]